MADEKKQGPKAADKAAKEAQVKAQKEAAAREKARKEAQIKEQKEAAAKEKAEKDAQVKAQKEAAAKQKAEKDAQVKAQKEAAAKEKAEREAQVKAQKDASANEKHQKEQKPKAPKAEKPEKVKKEKPPKMTRKEKKERLEEQMKLEKELVEAGKIPLRNRYKPRGIFWRIFGICLAFILGIFAALGSIVGVGAVFVTKPARDSLASLKDVMDFDAEEFISDEYLDMSIIDLVQSIMEDVGALGNPSELTLATFSKYTPLIDTYLQDIVDENLKELGITINIDDLRNVKFSEYANYLEDDLLPQITLGPILGLDKNITAARLNENAPLYALCYGTYGTDYTVEDGAIVQIEGGMKPLSVADLMDFSGSPEGGETPAPTAASNDPNDEEGGFMARIKSIPLGVFLGFNIRLESEKTDMNGMVYSLCYGNEGDDYDFTHSTIGGETFDVVNVLHEEKMLTLNTLLTNSDGIFDSISLGTVLGLNTATELANRENNRMMYALCYGVEGEDYDVTDGKIVMKDGKSERTLGYLTSNMNAVINDIEVDSILDISPKTEAIVRTIAYGNEMAKDDNGNYLKDAEGNYQTEDILNDEGQPTGKKQYAGDGKYIIEGDGDDAKIVMLEDPNNPGTKYKKKTIGDLTADDADLIGGITLGSILDIDSNSSGIMQAMRDWTINDLTKKEKIEGLKIGDILNIEANPDGTQPDDVSNIMWALRNDTIADLKNQDTINNLKLSDVLDIKSDTGILGAMQNWTLNDLSEQNRIERLKLSQILDIDESDPNTSPIMIAMKDWRIADLTDKDKVNTLTLGDVLSIGDDAPAMLHVLQGMSLDEISKGIDTVTLEDALGADAFNVDAGEETNQLLEFLRYTQVKDIADRIKQLTVEDLFGDDMWTYAEADSFDPNVRTPDSIKLPQNAEITTKYYYEEAEVTPGYYTADHKKVNDADVKQDSYVERPVYVTRVTEYYEVDYSKKPSEWTTKYEGNDEILHDNFSDYYVDADGVRHDLEAKYSYKNGNEDVTGKKILENKDATGEDDKYYYIEKTPVTLFYASAGNTLYIEEQITKKYFYNDKEYTRYHAGVWYLLLGEAQEGRSGHKFTMMGDLVSEVTGKINNLTLGGMYVHELVDEDPSVDITDLVAMAVAMGHTELNGKTNLNELTVNGVISLINAIAQSPIWGTMGR